MAEIISLAELQEMISSYDSPNRAVLEIDRKIYQNEITCNELTSIGHLRKLAKEAFPEPEKKVEFELPKPMFSASYDNPKEMEVLKNVFGRESIDHAFGPEGRGMDEIKEKLVVEKIKQNL